MIKSLPFKLFLLLFILSSFYATAQITLTHNSCEVVRTNIHSCTSATIYWSRTFTLQDFGIGLNDEFIITTGQVAVVNTSWRPTARFRIYAIDNGFPSTFLESNLIGISQEIYLPWYVSLIPEIVTLDFNTPIVVPAGTERILVEVEKGGDVNSSAVAFIAGSIYDNDFSWQRRCITGGATPVNGFVTATDMGRPDANFYINVSGVRNNIISPFSLNYTNDCSQTLKEFYLNNTNNIASVIWNFGDPASGVNNTSNLTLPSHDFSASGQYSIAANIIQNDGSTYVINETISVAEPPIAYPVNDIPSCEDNQGLGVSSSFDTSNVVLEVVNGQTGVVVSYYDQNGNQLPSPLPNPFTNTQANTQEITVRVSNSSDLCCYSETIFDLLINPLPEIASVNNLFACDNNRDGYAIFDLSNLTVDLVNGQPNILVELFDSSNNSIPLNDLNDFENLILNQDYIDAVLTNSITNCASETRIVLDIYDNPEVTQLPELYACDDNADGISEYFDTGNVETQVLNGQTGMHVTYYKADGTELPSPLANPFTNSETNNQNITVRVTDDFTNCYSETILHLETITQPNISQPDNLYACNQGDGYATFETTLLEGQIIGNQTGLSIHYYDSNSIELSSPLPALFQNVEPYQQTIYVKVVDASNSLCYSERSFDLIVNRLPVISIEEEYFICNLAPSIIINVESSYTSYEWLFEDGTLISSTYSAEIINEGSYVLTVAELKNNIICENSFSFRLIRSNLPEIVQVNHGELGNNYMEIIASGDGDFEYSINGVNYQDNNYFSNLEGGTYTVFVKDKDGCGQDSKEITIIDYPKIFTPNNDGYNDYWQIEGVTKFPNSKILIFDRYGKLIKQLSSNSLGWDGTFNGNTMNTNDYWFTVELGTGKTFSGHFTLKR
ncbi:T9SS type B sorting domain-containing protein [Lacinutrix sp. MEBiC02404]